MDMARRLEMARRIDMPQKLDAGLLECDFCKQVFPIHEENFPPDLFALMVKYNVSQLIWICASCKKIKERNFMYFLSLAERQREMEKTLSNMAVAINQLQSVIQLNTSDASVLDRSSSLDSGFEKTTHSSPLNGSFSPRMYVDSSVSNIEEQHNSEDAASGCDWTYVYQKNEDISLCSLRGTTFFGSLSSGSTVNSIGCLQDNYDCPKSSSNLPLSNYNAKKALGILKKILSEKIKIDDGETKENKAILSEFLENLVSALKEGSPEFKQLYQRTYYTGSSYEELRIAKANEFDINLVLQFPQQKNSLKVEFPEVYPSFARCVRVTPGYENNPRLSKLFFEGEFLMPAKVRSWMQSLISKFITVPNFEKPSKVIKLEPSQSGPASTIKLTTVDGCTIDIDLVPVLHFANSDWPLHCNSASLGHFALSSEDKFWFLVPKPFISNERQPPPESQQLWRVHLPGVEKKFLHGRNCVKPLIKLLKLLRDKENNWKIISSYFLKTVLMWEIRKHPDVLFWNEALMAERFLEVLKKLDKYVMHRNLPHFLFPTVNLFVKMNCSHSESIHGRLVNIVKEIEKDTSNLYSVFGVDVCLAQ